MNGRNKHKKDQKIRSSQGFGQWVCQKIFCVGHTPELRDESD